MYNNGTHFKKSTMKSNNKNGAFKICTKTFETIF